MRNISFYDTELMKIQASTLYVLNEKNRIVTINEPNQTSSPVLFIGKTKDTTLTYFRHDLPQQIIEEINRHTLGAINVFNLCRIIEKYKKVKDIWIGPAYAFKQNITQIIDSNIIMITESNSHLLTKHFDGFSRELEDRTPIVGYIIDGFAVSVCCCARKSNVAVEASLLTTQQYRGKGFAQKVVTEWSREISNQGLIPLYSTSWDNLSSQKVAQKLGLVQYGMDFSISSE